MALRDPLRARGDRHVHRAGNFAEHCADAAGKLRAQCGGAGSNECAEQRVFDQILTVTVPPEF